MVIFRLKDDWDEAVSPPDIQPGVVRGHFAGRKDELRALTAELSTKRSGSILVAGHRGVGKTSLVYEALRRANPQGRKLLPVVMCAPHMGIVLPESNDNDASKGKGKVQPRDQTTAVQNLIRRLYSAVSHSQLLDKNHKKVKEATDALYRKAVAREFKLHERDEAEASSALSSSEASRTTVAVDVGAVLRLVLGVGIGMALWLLAGAWSWRPWPYICQGLSFVSLAVGTSLAVHRRDSRRTAATEQKARRSSEELYSFDNSLGNLVDDLERLHSTMEKANLTPVYVIDEVDKVAEIDELLQFKGLFTLSQAIFIFIAGEEVYSHGLADGMLNAGGRKNAYTAFTSRYFVSRPQWNDLRRYLDDVLTLVSRDANDDPDDALRALAFDADNDYFDLKARIRDRISDNPDYALLVSVDVTDMVRQRAALHALATYVYETYIRKPCPSAWRDNELALRAVFKEATRVVVLGAGATVATLTVGGPLGPVQRFQYALWRAGAADRGADPPSGKDARRLLLQYTGRVPDAIDKVLALNEEEAQVVEHVRQIGGIVLGLANARRTLRGEEPFDEQSFWLDRAPAFTAASAEGTNWDSLLDQHLEYYTILTAEPPGRLPEPEVRSKLGSLKQSVEKLRGQTPRLLTSIMAHVTGTGLDAGLTSSPQPFVDAMSKETRGALMSCSSAFLTDKSSRIALVVSEPENGWPTSIAALFDQPSTTRLFLIAKTAPRHCPKEVFVAHCADADGLMTQLPALARAIYEFLKSEPPAA
jgi:hypothetical protein